MIDQINQDADTPSEDSIVINAPYYYIFEKILANASFQDGSLQKAVDQFSRLSKWHHAIAQSKSLIYQAMGLANPTANQLSTAIASAIQHQSAFWLKLLLQHPHLSNDEFKQQIDFHHLINNTIKLDWPAGLEGFAIYTNNHFNKFDLYQAIQYNSQEVIRYLLEQKNIFSSDEDYMDCLQEAGATQLSIRIHPETFTCVLTHYMKTHSESECRELAAALIRRFDVLKKGWLKEENLNQLIPLLGPKAADLYRLLDDKINYYRDFRKTIHETSSSDRNRFFNSQELLSEISHILSVLVTWRELLLGGETLLLPPLETVKKLDGDRVMELFQKVIPEYRKESQKKLI